MNDAEFRKMAHETLARNERKIEGCCPECGHNGKHKAWCAWKILLAAGASPDPILGRHCWACGCWQDVKARSLCPKHTGPGEAAFMVAMRGCTFVVRA